RPRARREGPARHRRVHRAVAAHRPRTRPADHRRDHVAVPPRAAGRRAEPGVPGRPALLRRRVQPRPRRQRRAEDDGPHPGVLIAEGHLPKTAGVPLWVVLAAHTAIALGTLSGGWRIVKTMGSKITKLQPVGGVAAESGAAATLFFTSAAG